jgi:hypothetical protein
MGYKKVDEPQDLEKHIQVHTMHVTNASHESKNVADQANLIPSSRYSRQFLLVVVAQTKKIYSY